MLQKIVRRFAPCVALLLLAFAAPARAADDPAAFIRDLGDKAVEIIKNQHMSKDDRKAAFTKLFTGDFDVPAIGKFVLGRYWRTATPEQQQEYMKLFGQYVVDVYADRFSNYQGEQFKVIGSQPTGEGTATVTSQILRPNGGPPIHIDWRVAKEQGGYKITDVIVENLSMAVTQRSEFASVIERGGGNVQALIDTLRQKVNAG